MSRSMVSSTILKTARSRCASSRAMAAAKGWRSIRASEAFAVDDQQLHVFDHRRIVGIVLAIEQGWIH